MLLVAQGSNNIVDKQPAIVVFPGVQGPPGNDGVSASAFEHIQNTAINPIVVNHNLGFRPNVSVKTLGGVEVIAEVIHTSINQSQIFFDSPSTAIINFS
jgi:hypothetical protein